MPPRNGPPRLEDIPEDITAREVMWTVLKLDHKVEPALEYITQAKGVIAVMRWLGPLATLILGAILIVLVRGSV